MIIRSIFCTISVYSSSLIKTPREALSRAIIRFIYWTGHLRYRLYYYIRININILYKIILYSRPLYSEITFIALASQLDVFSLINWRYHLQFPYFYIDSYEQSLWLVHGWISSAWQVCELLFISQVLLYLSETSFPTILFRFYSTNYMMIVIIHWFWKKQLM